MADLLEAHVPCCSFCNRVHMYCCAGTACNAMRARCEVRLGSAGRGRNVAVLTKRPCLDGDAAVWAQPLVGFDLREVRQCRLCRLHCHVRCWIMGQEVCLRCHVDRRAELLDGVV